MIPAEPGLVKYHLWGRGGPFAREYIGDGIGYGTGNLFQTFSSYVFIPLNYTIILIHSRSFSLIILANFNGLIQGTDREECQNLE